MGINEDIAEAEHNVNLLKSIRSRTINDLSTLKVGDVIYDEGFYNHDMFPLQIIGIDLKTCRVEVNHVTTTGRNISKWYDAIGLFMKDPNDANSFIKIGD